MVSVFPHLTGIPEEEERELRYSEIAIDMMDEGGDGKVDFGELQAYLSLAAEF